MALAFLAAQAAPWPSYRAVRVWQRNRDTFLKLAHVELWPSFIEPVLQLVAMGLGLGAYVRLTGDLSYLQFIAPALVATSAMFSASFECTYGSFIRMQYQKTYDAIIATPVSIEDVIAGEILWGATRAVMTSTVVAIVILAFGLVQSPLAILLLPLVALEGFMFASIAMLFTSLSPSVYMYNYFFTLFITPLFLFSGVFFPLSGLPPWLQGVAWFSPLTHVVAVFRPLVLGQASWALATDVAWQALLSGVVFPASLFLMRRRLIK